MDTVKAPLPTFATYLSSSSCLLQRVIGTSDCFSHPLLRMRAGRGNADASLPCTQERGEQLQLLVLTHGGKRSNRVRDSARRTLPHEAAAGMCAFRAVICAKLCRYDLTATLPGLICTCITCVTEFQHTFSSFLTAVNQTCTCSKIILFMNRWLPRLALKSLKAFAANVISFKEP